MQINFNSFSNYSLVFLKSGINFLSEFTVQHKTITTLVSFALGCLASYYVGRRYPDLVNIKIAHQKYFSPFELALNEGTFKDGQFVGKKTYFFSSII